MHNIEKGSEGTKESSVDTFKVVEREKISESDILYSVSSTIVADCVLGN